MIDDALKRNITFINRSCRSRPPEKLASGVCDKMVAEGVWSAAAEHLQERNFPTIAAASEALIEEVLNRLQSSDVPQDDLREFLTTLLHSDPALIEELKQVLEIKPDLE